MGGHPPGSVHVLKSTECRHILPNGRKCHSPALRGKPFCFHHAKLHFRNSAARKPRELAQLSTDDLRGIRTALSEAITSLRSPLADTRRAGLLLYGLHLASNLSKREVCDRRVSAMARSSRTP